MKIEKTADELLQRYLKAVERYLPINKRSDISKEIESMVYDICEERYHNQDVDEKRMESILVELGKPSRLAAKYKDIKPLIGPELTPIFKLVVFIILLVTSIVSIIDFALSINSMSAGDVGLYFLELFSSLTGVVGTVFIIFFILERAIKNKAEIEFDDESWKIKDLPQLSERIPGKAEIIAGLVFSVIAIIVLNLFIDKIGIYSNTAGVWQFTPILSDELKRLLPLFSLRIAIGAVVVLPFIAGSDAVSGGKKNYYYQLSQIGLNIFDIGILILLISRGFNAFFITEGFSTAGLADLIPIVDKLFYGVLILIIALSLFNLVKRALVILPRGRV